MKAFRNWLSNKPRAGMIYMGLDGPALGNAKWPQPRGAQRVSKEDATQFSFYKGSKQTMSPTPTISKMPYLLSWSIWKIQRAIWIRKWIFLPQPQHSEMSTVNMRTYFLLVSSSSSWWHGWPGNPHFGIYDPFSPLCVYQPYLHRKLHESLEGSSGA